MSAKIECVILQYFPNSVTQEYCSIAVFYNMEGKVKYLYDRKKMDWLAIRYKWFTPEVKAHIESEILRIKDSDWGFISESFSDKDKYASIRLSKAGRLEVRQVEKVLK